MWKLVALITENEYVPINGENVPVKQIDVVRLHQNGTISFEKKATVPESQNGEWKLAEPVG